ncbi:MAG TPA: hypothetical protein ENJ44_01005 [Oceanospirillales bacterium]|nr:hypothetical protein [Oceanospirillales bacterium]
MKIKDKVLLFSLSAMMMAGCTTVKTKTTLTKPNGEVVVTEEIKTSKNTKVISAVRKAVIVYALYTIDGGAGVLLSSAVELQNHKENLEIKKQELRLKQKELEASNTQNI